MSALTHQLHEGVDRMLEGLSEGWHYLKTHAAGAMTRFTPGQAEPTVRELGRKTSRWGLLATDVWEDEAAVHVRLEVPGLQAGDFDLTVRANNILSVRGEKRIQHEDSQGDHFVIECAYGRFDRVVPLPAAVTVEKSTASYHNGVLRIDLPKREKARRVPIRGVE